MKTIRSADGLRKAEIYRRSDGSYGGEGHRISPDAPERCWTAYGFDGCRAGDVAIAEREVLERMQCPKVLIGMTVNARFYELNLVTEFDAARAAKDIEKIEEIQMRACVDRASMQAIVEAL